jgi:hypothetical protein
MVIDFVISLNGFIDKLISTSVKRRETGGRLLVWMSGG